MSMRKVIEEANRISEFDEIQVTEAISMKDMGFKTWNGGKPSFRIGRLEGVSPDQLVKVFGKPNAPKSGDGKSTMGWNFINPQGLVFTVYDYNNPPKSMSASHNWSVGGIDRKHSLSVQRAFRMMGVPGKMIKESDDGPVSGNLMTEVQHGSEHE